MNSHLYIKGKEVDLSTDNIPMDFNSNLFGKTNVIKSNKTYTIKLPRTNNNNNIFEYPDVLGKDNSIIREYNNASFIKDDVEIFTNGRCVLISVTNDSFNVCLVWGFDNTTISKLEEIKSLRELDFDEQTTSLKWYGKDLLTIYQDPNEIINTGYANYNLGVDLDIDLIRDPNDYPNLTTNLDKNYYPATKYNSLCNIHPFVSLKCILDAIISKSGVNLNIPNIDDFKNECLVLTSDENILNRNLKYQRNRLYYNLINQKSYFIPGIGFAEYFLFNGATFYDTTSSRGFIKTSPHIELNGLVDFEFFNAGSESEPIYGLKIKKKITGFKMQVHLKLIDDLGQPVVISKDFELLKNGYNPYDGSATVLYAKSYSGGEYTDTIDLTSLTLNENDIIYLSWKYTQLFTPDFEKCEMDIEIFEVTREDIGTKNIAVKYPKVYDIASNLPNISAINFLKIISNLHGLYFKKIETNNEIKLESYEEMTKGEFLDLSDRLIISNRQTEFKLNDFGQFNYFTFAKDSDNLDILDFIVNVEDKTIKQINDWVSIPFSATNDNLDIEQYIVSREDYKYSVNQTKKGLRILGLKTSYDGNNYFKELETDPFKSESILTRYDLYTSVIKKPTRISLEFILSMKEIKEFDYSIPIYVKQYGQYFICLNMRVSKYSVKMELLKI